MPENSDQKSEDSACGCGGGTCCGGWGKWIWVVLIIAITGVLIAKNAGKKKVSANSPTGAGTSAVVAATGAPVAAPEGAIKGQPIPRMVDLGAGKCIPCKMMAPILEDLKKTYAGKMDVQFLDVWENPDAGKKFGINVIPTQIFYDAAGNELFRHEGFLGKEDILAKWKELGVELTVGKKE
jgi:thioredoxin 1